MRGFLLSFGILVLVSALALSFPLQVVDSSGRSVKIASPPQRVVVVSTYWAEVLHILGLDSKIVGVGKYTPFDPHIPEAVRKKPVVGSVFKGINWETVISLSPDLIITDWYGGRYGDIDVIKRAQKLGIPALALRAEKIEDNTDIVLLLGRVFGKDRRAKELAGWMREKLDIIRKASANLLTDRKNVLVIRAPKDISKPVSVCAKGSAWGQIPEFIGAHNLAFDMDFKTPWPKLDLEKLIAYWGETADVIIFYSWSEASLKRAIDLVKHDERWMQIKAVREGKVFGVVAGYRGFLDWGPRIVVGIYQIANAVYPGVFPNWENIAKELLERFYGEKFEK